MVRSKKFQDWIRTEAARATGQLKELNDRIDRELIKNTKIEFREDGRWIEQKEETK